MSRVVLIFEITFKIHYLLSLERSWKSSTWRSNQMPPVAPFSLLWLDLSFLKLATWQATALLTPSSIPEEGLGTPSLLHPSGSRLAGPHFTFVWQFFPGIFQRASQADREPSPSSLYPGENQRQRLVPGNVSHTQNPIPSSWSSTDITPQAELKISL